VLAFEISNEAKFRRNKFDQFFRQCRLEMTAWEDLEFAPGEIIANA
jgi:hypothetical protein